jgi:hypothetical protein
MKYQVELTVSVSGTVEIEAESIEAARQQAEKITAYSADVSLSVDDFKEDGMFPYVEIEGISGDEEEEESEEG